MPSARGPGSPSMGERGLGGTTERADQGMPGALGDLAITCTGVAESEQKRQADSGRGPVSTRSSPVMTQERVMGSLRSSIRKENTGREPKSTAISYCNVPPSHAKEEGYFARGRNPKSVPCSK